MHYHYVEDLIKGWTLVSTSNAPDRIKQQIAEAIQEFFTHGRMPCIQEEFQIVKESKEFLCSIID